jgi:hypothetical protein
VLDAPPLAKPPPLDAPPLPEPPLPEPPVLDLPPLPEPPVLDAPPLPEPPPDAPPLPEPDPPFPPLDELEEQEIPTSANAENASKRTERLDNICPSSVHCQKLRNIPASAVREPVYASGSPPLT